MIKIGNVTLLGVEDIMSALKLGKDEVIDLLKRGEIRGREINGEWVIPDVSIIDYLTNLPPTIIKGNKPKIKNNGEGGNGVIVKVFPHPKSTNIIEKLKKIKETGEVYYIGSSTSIGSMFSGTIVLFRYMGNIVGEGVVGEDRDFDKDYIIFDSNSIKIYSEPISVKELLKFDDKRDHVRAYLRISENAYRSVVKDR